MGAISLPETPTYMCRVTHHHATFISNHQVRTLAPSSRVRTRSISISATADGDWIRVVHSSRRPDGAVSGGWCRPRSRAARRRRRLCRRRRSTSTRSLRRLCARRPCAARRPTWPRPAGCAPGESAARREREGKGEESEPRRNNHTRSRRDVVSTLRKIVSLLEIPVPL